MSLFFSMLPLYLLGNLHCLGMCGPLVATIGNHTYRNYYFLGRGLSFSLAGLFAGLTGALLYDFFKLFEIQTLVSIFLGLIMILLGLSQVFSWEAFFVTKLKKKLAKTSHRLATLLLQDTIKATFLFGFFTILLPCGQTVIVFCGCALSQNPLVGLFNGAAFALLTTPSLFLGMQARRYLGRLTQYHQKIIGMLAVIFGLVSVLRGLAEKGVISHLILNESYHIVLY